MHRIPPAASASQIAAKCYAPRALGRALPPTDISDSSSHGHLSQPIFTHRGERRQMARRGRSCATPDLVVRVVAKPDLRKPRHRSTARSCRGQGGRPRGSSRTSARGRAPSVCRGLRRLADRRSAPCAHSAASGAFVELGLSSPRRAEPPRVQLRAVGIWSLSCHLPNLNRRGGDHTAGSR